MTLVFDVPVLATVGPVNLVPETVVDVPAPPWLCWLSARTVNV